MVELANASVVCPRDPGSNLGIDKIFSDWFYVGFEFKFVGRWIQIGMLHTHTLNHNMYVEMDHLKMCLIKKHTFQYKYYLVPFSLGCI